MPAGQRVVCSYLFAVILVWAWLGGVAVAQTDLNEVHVTPRVSLDALQPMLDPSLDAHSATIKKSVELVLVPVSITDQADRAVIGLARGNFRVFEGSRQREIEHFSSEDTPISVGIILDLSKSMVSKMDRAREAVTEFCKTANSQDEFFLITFSDTPELLVDFSSYVDEIQNRLALVAPQGRTALLDAIYLGLRKMKQAHYQRKALLIISDGGDNRSRYSARQVREVAKEADVAIYGIGVYDPVFQSVEERMGPALLEGISEVTAGRMFTLDNPNELPAVAAKIGNALRNQYVLGYRPEGIHDGKWHKIKVKVKARLPRGLSFLQVFAKPGYYAPTD